MLNYILPRKSAIEKLQSELTTLKNERNAALIIAKALAQKDFESNLSHFNNDKSDVIESLLTLRKNLGESHEIEKQNNWITTGLTKIGFLFEDGGKDLNAILDSILSNLVRYTEANQGALYLVNRDDSSCLELAAIYAYGRKRYVNEKIDLNYGLIGQVFQEGSYTYMTDVPQNYVKITSGLGEATPRSIFAIPLKTRTTTLGVLELAFFQKLNPFEIEFLEKISENLANTIFLIQSASNNVKLLQQSQSAAEQLRSKEAELLKNVEDLEMIQSSLTMKNIELERATKEIEEKKKEIERTKEAEQELIESKLTTQQAIHELTVKRLIAKIAELEKKLNSGVLGTLLN
ncbi:MAG TPA: GAF domain-containing protein [Cyclobacteriaceae bacterium]|nr:GAF domain-containing protein [Cyclobacteriaceae bacterium]